MSGRNEDGGFQREVQHHEAYEIDRLSRITLENLTGSEVLAPDRIGSPAKKLKTLNSAGVALRAGTLGTSSTRYRWPRIAVWGISVDSIVQPINS